MRLDQEVRKNPSCFPVFLIDPPAFRIGSWAAGLLTVAALGYAQRRRFLRSLKRA